MIHGHLEYMPLKANPKRSEEYAQQHIRYCNAQIRHCRRQLRYYRRLRLKSSWTKLYKLHPLLMLLLTLAVFRVLIVISEL